MNKTKRRIFNTAVKLFSDKGYDNASVEEITAVAGVAKGSLYYHFAKKEDIFDMMLEEGMKLLRNSIELKTKEKCKKAVFEYIKIVEKIVKEGIENNEFYDGDVEAIAAGIFGVTCSSLIYRIKKNREVDVKTIYQGFEDYITRAICKRKQDQK